MTSIPAPGPYVPPSHFPWKTIGGVLLWALGVVLHAVLPQTPPVLPVALQGLGAGLGTFGAVSATTDLVNAAPFLRFSPKAGGGWAHVVTMMAGGLWYALLQLVAPFIPAASAGVHQVAAVGSAASVVAIVTGWRLWLHQIVGQTRL